MEINNYLCINQLESIKAFLEDFLEIPDFEEAKKQKPYINTYTSYLKILAKSGIKLLLERNLVDLKQIMFDILETDNVLIPLNILEELIK